MEYIIKIKLESDLCVGNGEAKGNAIDRDICTDKYGIPYIPAKRLKGCLRQTAEFLQDNGFLFAQEDNLTKLFGNPFGEEGNLTIDDAHLPNVKALRQSIIEMRRPYLKKYSHPENVENIFTAVRGQTSLDQGVKIDSTLRFTRVLTKNNDTFYPKQPLEFVSLVHLSDYREEQLRLLEACCKGTRHIGIGRNRGLGNVSLSFCKASDKDKKVKVPDFIPDADKTYQMVYTVVLDSPVTIPGCGELMTTIPARSVIGCMASYFKKNSMGDDVQFQNLFLNGMVKWSALTPVIEGSISTPVPVMLVKLKNGGGKLINQFAETNPNWKKLKPKTIEGSYASVIQDSSGIKGFRVADVETIAQYHNSFSKTMLYTQDAINEGYIYGGSVTFLGKDYNSILKLITESKLRFGRSKNIQYANCYLYNLAIPTPVKNTVKSENSKKLYVLLQSDMILSQNGMYLTEDTKIRSRIMKELEKAGLQSQENQTDVYENKDIVRYGIIGGFQNMWHLQKPHVPIIRAGSMYMFDGDFKNIPEQIVIGDMQQEGFGVCKIFTEKEIRQMTKVERSSVERQFVSSLSTDNLKPVEYSLTKQCVRECLLKYAHEFQGDCKDVPVGRLRLMLEQANDYSDLLRRINTMKTSDVSSISEGRKKATKDLMNEFYGVGTIQWKKLLASEEGLYEAVQDEESIKKIEREMWKLPLMQLLHILHYEKENRL